MPAVAKPRRPSVEQLLDAQVEALDRLIGEVRGGIRSAVHFDQLEADAGAIGKGLRDAFRRAGR